MMETASLLVVSVFLLCGASVASSQLSIAHSYPLDGNFSYVTLTCLDGALPALGAEFQLNTTDTEEVIHDVSDDGNGTISFVLTQDQEGEFTCSRGGTTSNGISLAAQPQLSVAQTHHVVLPSDDSEVLTELQCDIQPGALAQRYSVQWRRLYQSGRTALLEAHAFSLMLNVTSALDGSQYQCEVTINHDGSLIRTYTGARNTLLISISEENNDQLAPAVIVAVVAIIVGGVGIATIIVGVGLLVLWRYRTHARKKAFLQNLRMDIFEPTTVQASCILPDVHVDMSSRFHSADTPQLLRQYGVPNGSQYQQNPDTLEPIHNYSQASAASGLSALSDSDMSPSNPPSPAVSSIKDDEDVFNFNVYKHGYNFPHYGQYNHHPLFKIGPQSSLNVPQGRPRRGSQSSDHTQHSEHSHHSGKTHTTHHSNHSNRSVRSHRNKSRNPGEENYLHTHERSHHSENHPHLLKSFGHSSRRRPVPPSITFSPSRHPHYYSGHANRLKRSEANSGSSRNKPSHHSKDGGSHTHLRVHEHIPRHHSQSLQQLRESQSRFWSSKGNFTLAPTPMRSSCSDEHIRRVPHSHITPPHQSHRAKHHLDLPQQVAGHTKGEAHQRESHELSDAVLLQAIGCLMHHVNCKIPRCQCRQVKERFQHLLPQTNSQVSVELEPTSSGEPDPTGHRRRRDLSLELQNENTHPHYHMTTSHSHIHQSKGIKRVLQRRRSRSVDLTPVVEQPNTPPETPTGKQVRDFPPTTTQPPALTRPSVLLREVSLSADNLPYLHLNDYPMAFTTCNRLGGTDSMIGPPRYLPADERIVPPCVKPTATLHHCTSQGIDYNDEWNDFTLKIPDGAIPEGESLTIDIGVALYGPFQYPEGLRPVSPVFWICVRDKKFFQFLKPVEVTLPHFLTLDGQEDVQSLGLAFLKGDHEMRWKHKTCFQQADGTTLFRPGSEYGVLHTHHFCYLCITSKKSKETIRKAKFCMFATVPHVFAAHKPTYAFFFVTFLLKTCLKTIRRQIKNTPELLSGSFREVKQDFQFADDQSEPSLEIEIPQQHPAGWTLGLEFNTKITQSEMDFIEMDEDELELKEDEQIYPPKFRIIIGCSPAAQQSQARIEFKGALKELVFDIPLAPQPSESGTLPPQPPVKQKSTVLSSPVSLPDLLNHVGVRILSKWKMFGILLDIPVSELDTYPSHNCLECYARVFDSWERRGSPELAWGTVINVLESPSISERRLAEEVRKKMASSIFSPSHTLL